ncbi:Ulp1-like peptidase [Cucumis melo var. makuwa]|uniref:Ulp1-like peptidase n=1 Tax=Cucumis melo var. makuwa TaxID=1194695 RepID=A0A5D3BRB4_CUCMM|nr:Ulp1-like peptidase [Cucumis melo var. makuwa]TYK02271.1 Ulp1-like peptidase [Cucumis melo var. makuwa]
MPRKCYSFYFIELAMMGRERRLKVDCIMLGLIDDLEDFVSYNWSELIWIEILGSLKGALKRKVWANEIVSSISGRVANRAFMM